MTIPASRRDELRRLVERSRTATDMYQQALHEVRNAVPGLLDEIERLEALMVRPNWQDEVWQRAESQEVARLKAALGEALDRAESAYEDQRHSGQPLRDPDLDRLRKVLG